MYGNRVSIWHKGFAVFEVLNKERNENGYLHNVVIGYAIIDLEGKQHGPSNSSKSCAIVKLAAIEEAFEAKKIVEYKESDTYKFQPKL